VRGELPANPKLQKALVISHTYFGQFFFQNDVFKHQELLGKKTLQSLGSEFPFRMDLEVSKHI
jgi:hypothetical protein